MDIKKQFIVSACKTIPNDWSTFFKENSGLYKLLLNTLLNIVNDTKTVSMIVPSYDKVFNALITTPINKVKVVLLGQDPYANHKQATGLSFAVNREIAIPPSLNNIYRALINNGKMYNYPLHGDLTCWGNNGILLLNSALTVLENNSKVHVELWHQFTSTFLQTFSQLYPNVEYILLGSDAQKFKQYIKNDNVYEWSHPSSLCQYNNNLSDKRNFVFCDVFNRVKQDVNWNVDSDPMIELIEEQIVTESYPLSTTIDTTKVYGFSDGAFSFTTNHNYYGWVIFDKDKLVETKGRLNIGHETSQREELMGFLSLLTYIDKNYIDRSVLVITDSAYTFNTFSSKSYFKKWITNPKLLEDKKNLDIIKRTYAVILRIEIHNNIQFEHIHSHKKEPSDKTSSEWFKWYFNDYVDKTLH